MKRLKYYISLIIVITLFSCKEDLPLSFNSDDRYIYFDIPFQVDNYGRIMTTRVDSLIYSFSLEDPSLTSYTYKIPVNIAGFPSDQDKAYKVEVVKDKTTAAPEDWDVTTIEKPIFRQGRMSDTLYIKLKRSPSLKTSSKSITLRILPNNDFKLGEIPLTTIKLSFSDILQPPSWYKTWKKVFGLTFYREVYVKWKEIYYYGADPNIETIGGPGKGQRLWWGNMPYYASESWYPSTYIFIRKLKQYFIDNEVYPDGDKTKPRILLP